MTGHVNLKYADIKSIIAKKNLAWQHVSEEDRYFIFAIDTGVIYSSTIYKSPILIGGVDANQEQANQTDFENNYESLSNYAIGNRPYAFATPDFQFNGDSPDSTTVPLGQTLNVDYTIPGMKPLYLNGAMVITQNSSFGDFAAATVIDVNNVLGGGHNLVLAQYVKRWYIDPNRSMDIETPYAGKIPPGVVVRVTYTSVGGQNVQVAINYKLHLAL